MANDSAANDPATHCQRKRKKNTGTVEKAAKGRIGINFPGEREGERRNGMLSHPRLVLIV